MQILGVDVGGTGVKAAPVDTDSGELLKGRERIVTPQPATPEAVSKVIRELQQHFAWKGPIGVALPAVVKQGVTLTAANIDPAWLGFQAEKLLSKVTGQKITLLNDADAAGLAEARFGAAKGCKGIVFMATLGTGIGSALLVNGVLVPNTELGHLEIRGKDSERRASDRARQRKQLSWKKWAENVSEYLQAIEALHWPDLIVLGGGVSKEYKEFVPLLKTRAKVVPAKLLNQAGIVGAALAAAERLKLK